MSARLDPQASKVLAGLLGERKQQVSSMELRLARPGDIPGYSMAPRLVDRLGQLLSAIDRVLAAPTPLLKSSTSTSCAPNSSKTWAK